MKESISEAGTREFAGPDVGPILSHIIDQSDCYSMYSVDHPGINGDRILILDVFKFVHHREPESVNPISAN